MNFRRFLCFACRVYVSAIQRRGLAHPTPSSARAERAHASLSAVGSRRWPTSSPAEGGVSFTINFTPFHALRRSVVRDTRRLCVIGDSARAPKHLSMALRPHGVARLPAGKIKDPRLKGLREEEDNQFHPIRAAALIRLVLRRRLHLVSFYYFFDTTNNSPCSHQ